MLYYYFVVWLFGFFFDMRTIHFFNIIFLVYTCLFDNYIFSHQFLLYVMSTLIRKIMFRHLKNLLHMKFHSRGLIRSCKSHLIWDLQPPTLMSYIEDLERQLREIRNGIYEFQLELGINSIKRRIQIHFSFYIVWLLFFVFFTFTVDFILQIWFSLFLVGFDLFSRIDGG